MLRNLIRIRSKGTIGSQFCRYSTKLAENAKVRRRNLSKNVYKDALLDSIKNTKDLSSLYQLLNSNKCFLNQVRILSAFQVMCNIYLNRGSPGFQDNKKSVYLDLFKLLESRIEGFDLKDNTKDKIVVTTKKKHTRKKIIIEEKLNDTMPSCSSLIEDENVVTSKKEKTKKKNIMEEKPNDTMPSCSSPVKDEIFVTSKKKKNKKKHIVEKKPNDTMLSCSTPEKDEVVTSNKKQTRKKTIVEENLNDTMPSSIPTKEKSVDISPFYSILEGEEPIDSKKLHEIYDNLKSLDLNFQEILKISLKIQEQVDSKREEFYDSTLFDNFANKALKCDVDFYELCTFLSIIIAMRHMNATIVDEICDKYLAKASTNRVKCIRTSIKYFSSMNYKPQRWQEFIGTINFLELAKKMSPEQVLSLSCNLACLDYFDKNLLAAAANSSLDGLSMQWLVMLWQKLKTANLNAEFLDNHIKQHFDSLSTQEKKLPLLPTLIKALKDEIYIKNNCLTKLYHKIDHVICYRNGGFPIAINHRMADVNPEGSSNFIEDLQAPTNSTLILLLYYPESYFFRNSSELRNFASEQLKILESISDNWRILMIRESEWGKMADKDKTLFLMKEINSKLPTVDPIQ